MTCCWQISDVETREDQPRKHGKHETDKSKSFSWFRAFVADRHFVLRQRGGMKIGLYTITFLGVWYRGPALTLDALIDRARDYGYAGIEIDGKRPHGNPLDLPRARCEALRRRAEAE